MEQMIELTQGKKMKITKFGATWCPPCQVLKPIFEEIMKDSKYSDIDFEVIDVDDNAEKAMAYNVRTIPVMFFESDNGVEVINGLVSKEDIEKTIKNLKGD